MQNFKKLHISYRLNYNAICNNNYSIPLNRKVFFYILYRRYSWRKMRYSTCTGVATVLWSLVSSEYGCTSILYVPWRRRVSFESRYGTCACAFFCSSPNALMTFPKANNPLLMLTPKLYLINSLHV
jgi:hypothetical protein